MTRQLPALSLPQTVTVNGVSVPIRAGWAVAVRILCAFEDPSLTDGEKQWLLLHLLYPRVPRDENAAMRAAFAFLNGPLPADGDEAVRVYSFTQDLPYIAAAMQKSHGLDIWAQPQLHWHKFMVLFMDLDEECLFVRMVSLRRRRALGQLTREERLAWAQMRGLLELPQTECTTQEEQNFFDALNAARQKERSTHGEL